MGRDVELHEIISHFATKYLNSIQQIPSSPSDSFAHRRSNASGIHPLNSDNITAALD
jgi:hypothetical protein